MRGDPNYEEWYLEDLFEVAGMFIVTFIVIVVWLLGG